VEEFFPSLLELIQSKISTGTGIKPDQTRSNQTRSSALQSSSDETSDPQTVHAAEAAKCTEFKLSPEDDCHHFTSLDQSPSSTDWYYFSSSLCSEYVKSPPSTMFSALERPLADGQASREHAIGVVNGFTSEH